MDRLKITNLNVHICYILTSLFMCSMKTNCKKIVKQTACFMYKVMNNLVPSFFVNMFTANSAIHNYNTRQKNNLHVPSYRIKVRGHSVSVCGVNMWNDIQQYTCT